jgi:hypothetical protein
MEQNGPILLSLRYALSKLSVNLIEWESLLSKIGSSLQLCVPKKTSNIDIIELK